MLSIGGSAKMTADVLLNKIFTVNSLRKAVNNKMVTYTKKLLIH